MEKQKTNIKMTKTASRAKARKQLLQDFMKVEIYTAAVNAVEKHGWSLISMDEIANEIGGSKGTIYYYFKSKNELMSDMWIHVFKEMSNVLVPIFEDKALEPVEKLKKYIWNHVFLYCKNWRFDKTIWSNAFFITSWSETTDKKVQKARANELDKYVKLLAACSPGKGKKDNICELQAHAIASFLESIIVWYSEPFPISASEVADMVTNILMEGLRHGKVPKPR
jgi:AcrR family transcriptional regulator